MKARWVFGIAALALLHGGCSNLGYYVHSVKGHLGLMAARQPIDEMLRDPRTPETLRRRLETVADIRAFATDELQLPDTGSYRSYVDVDGPYVVWTVVAAPELSLTPEQWCFPIVGCVTYRGFYDRERARAYADELSRSGLDVTVNGVRAYSTLGWFDDPVPDTILVLPDYAIAAVVFHELAHERFYVPGDSAFNEGFAVAVERAGVTRWLEARRRAQERASFALAEAREAAFLELVSHARAQLSRLYESDTTEAEKRRLKAEIFGALRAQYVELRSGWTDGPNYDRWFAEELNNAKLASVATYHELVPAFERLLADNDGELGRFYQACEAIGELGPEERRRRLEALTKAAVDTGTERK
ncbi:MAG: aminopeptidase [Gammaproteobacteria bacterium]|nr:aminopeptidase [Gammaproteobacteria bacterium]NIR85976.1 aminopeptidase [Gammaproteobacteria bacterium]NIR91967.1 aminopeptidase [Gammaproteobacteria bacterium]NIU07217.1 aminopeptidase [Gammaproteobacteria bacterium]NIV54020.1 aminopeptidase [Gammaproteobacteria bacterium]